MYDLKISLTRRDVNGCPDRQEPIESQVFSIPFGIPALKTYQRVLAFLNSITS